MDLSQSLATDLNTIRNLISDIGKLVVSVITIGKTVKYFFRAIRKKHYQLVSWLFSLTSIGKLVVFSNVRVMVRNESLLC